MFLLVILSSLVNSQQCPSYSCGGSSTVGTCYLNSSSSGQVSYQLTPCELGYYCPLFTNSSECEIPAPYSRYPGEFCNENSDCIYGYCTSKNVCYAKAKGLSCTQSFQCNPGYSCVSSVCTAQIAIGYSCQRTEDCVNNAYCEYSICLGMFYLPIG